ncbi:MAG: hypothetical protein QW751_00100 [Candidatus Aenigmatarchaeota archaeon]|nr:hypothetical protein [Candidatus Aenigmarchaeota archaeon]
MAVEHLKKAWAAYKRNLCPLIGAYLLILFVVLVLAGAGIWLASMSSTAGLEPLLFGTIILLTAAAIVGAILSGAYIAVARDALKKKARIVIMWNVARERWKSLLGGLIIQILITILLFVPALVAGIYGYVNKSMAFIGLATLLAIPAIFASLLFNFIVYAIVIDKTKVMDGVCKSYRVVRKNYLDILVLYVIIVIISLVLTIIPILGMILSVLFVTPFSVLAFTSWYLSKRTQRR